MVANIMCLIGYLITAIMMIGIGISQVKSQKPVAFYSGEQPPREDELTDVHAWNVKHGIMWLVYGVIIIISYIIGTMLGESAWCLLPFCGGVMIPVIIMIFYHHRLVKKYKR